MPVRKKNAREFLERVQAAGQSVGGAAFREKVKSNRTRAITKEHLVKIYNLSEIDAAQVIIEFERGMSANGVGENE